MCHFEYVSKETLKPFKNEIDELIRLVQNDIRDKFTFQYKFIGSVARNMVTHDPKSNIGFDFDINLIINDENEYYSAKEIKQILICSFNKIAHQFGYDNCEDSTRVFTIKVKDTHNSKILHSCDFAIVHDYGNDEQEYIRFNKKQNSYSWEAQSKGFYKLPDKIVFCKYNDLWQAVRDLYLEKKNHNLGSNKKSRSIFAETIHQICQQNGYYDDTEDEVDCEKYDMYERLGIVRLQKI